MAAHQAPLSLGFSRQEHWSGLPFPSPMHESEKWKWSHSVMSDSSWPHGLQPTRLLRPWDSPGKSTGVGCHCLLLYNQLTCDKGAKAIRWRKGSLFNKWCWNNWTSTAKMGSRHRPFTFHRDNDMSMQIHQLLQRYNSVGRGMLIMRKGYTCVAMT